MHEQPSSTHEPSPSTITRLKEWTHAIVFAVIVATLVRWLVIEAFTIPSSSMEGTLLTGDYVLVSKLHYGARTPTTPLQIPLTHQTIAGMPAYSDWIQLPTYRMPGFSRIKRGDKVVFNHPAELDRPVDLRTYYIKRCVGLPGDTLHIRDARIYVGEEPQPQYPGLQYRYYLKTASRLDKPFFKKEHIREYIPVKGGYLVHTTPAIAARLVDYATIQLVKRLILPPGAEDTEIYATSEASPWNSDQFGPCTVPARGMTISINEEALHMYAQVIACYEGHQDVHIDEQYRLLIDGQPVTTYTFRQDYYFMVGDNRGNSLDSRFWGFVPRDHVVGKAVMVFMSYDMQGSFWEKVRWGRFLKPV